MRTLRLLIVALLTLTLPLSALAGYDTRGYCVMRANGVVVSMGKDCCDPARKLKALGKSQLCKTGQECNTFQNYTPTTTVQALPLPRVTYRVSVPSPVPIPFPLHDAQWRPPRTLS